MTSSNGNIFRVTGPFCREFTGPGEFPTQRPVTRSFDVFFDLRLNKRLSKQPWGWWFETPSWSLWRQCNGGWQVKASLQSMCAHGLSSRHVCMYRWTMIGVRWPRPCQPSSLWCHFKRCFWLIDIGNALMLPIIKITFIRQRPGKQPSGELAALIGLT